MSYRSAVAHAQNEGAGGDEADGALSGDANLDNLTLNFAIMGESTRLVRRCDSPYKWGDIPHRIPGPNAGTPGANTCQRP